MVFTAPSDQLNLAAIGAGGKGASDIRNASVNGRENVVALCDVDFSGSAKNSVEKFPTNGASVPLVPISNSSLCWCSSPAKAHLK